MTKRKINIFDYSKEINQAYDEGFLITTKYNEKVNSMVIGWGTMGIIYGEKIFITYVRNNRYTHELLDLNPEFSINIPLDKDFDKNIIKICGTKSGRNIDKIKEAKLTLVEPNIISAPAVKEFPLTMECEIIYKQDQVRNNLPTSIINRYYKNENGTYHTMYYGKILSSYIIEE